MATRFFTNHGEQTLFKKFQGVFESNPDIKRFDALVGYLRSSGYFALRPYLEKVPHIRILVGINVDSIMADCPCAQESGCGRSGCHLPKGRAATRWINRGRSRRRSSRAAFTALVQEIEQEIDHRAATLYGL